MLALHQRVFTDASFASAGDDSQASRRQGNCIPRPTWTFRQGTVAVGAARPAPIEQMPDFADIPNAVDRISKGRPILTIFCLRERYIL